MADSTASDASVSSAPIPPPPLVPPPISSSVSDPYSSPLYLHAADSSNLQLVPEKLQVPKPPPDHPDSGLWSRTNDMVCTWLTNAVSTDIASLIVYLDDAHLVWASLESRFKQRNVSKVYNIQQQLDTLHQGSMNLDTYFNKLTSLWEELRNFEPFPICTCGGCTCDGCTCGGCSCNLAEQWTHLFEKNNVVKFLMRLNDSYNAVRRQILMLEPLPNLSKAFNLVSQEEQQRISFGSSNDHAAFQGYKSPAPLLPTPHFPPNPQFPNSRNPNLDRSSNPINMLGSIANHQDRSLPSAESLDMRAQLAQAQELLAQYSSKLKNHGSSSNELGFAATTSPPPSPCIISTAILSTSSSNLSYLPIFWILDSGASCHICCDRTLFSEIHVVPPISISLPNGTSITVSESGSDLILALTIGEGKQMHNLYVLELPKPSSVHFPQFSPLCTALTASSVDLWHFRMGHPSHLKIKAIDSSVLSFSQSSTSQHCTSTLQSPSHSPSPVASSAPISATSPLTSPSSAQIPSFSPPP
ncbi:PREDICTED: uncharacterized protein LOC104825733 [Tarenaya hassleriana]|uniref:uncharacterized protein LOC104825733 n=1 Tax=Tarenaya hassleriana TaxID=28532 RepID=UPI00053C782D|nr:PREDICTED: uncharacterized protein LOC104825733 [Tarenaya hassleriana]